MIPASQHSTSAKNTDHMNLSLRPSSMESDDCRLVNSPDPPLFVARSFSVEISSANSRSPTIASGTSDLDLSLSHSCPIIHVGRVAITDCHDTDAWSPERKFYGKLDAVAASSTLGFNNTVPSNFSPVNAARDGVAVMDPRTQDLQTTERFPGATQQEEDTISQLCDWTIPGIPGSSTSAVRTGATNGPCSHEGLSEGRRRVGEILVRCGVINVSGTSPIEFTTSGCCDGIRPPPDSAPATPAEKLIVANDEVLITALADWTFEWMHTLVIQPYLRGGFRFQYQGKPSSAPISTVSRIRRVLSNVCNPVQVVIHALWLISTLIGNGARNNAPFLSVPIFRYLHNNGTFAAEGFMFRTLVACTMIGDKTINDAPLPIATWSRLTHIPQVILNATEKYALNCLKWDVVMTQTQWQDTITYLRSCIKMGSVFDPFAYEEGSASSVMARHLDELISRSYADEAAPQQVAPLEMEILAPQPIRFFTHWEVLDAAEWCPQDDPVINQKPRVTGIAPGADRSFNTLKAGTTANDLLDSILGSSSTVNLARLSGTPDAFSRGPLATAGVCCTHTIGIPRTYQRATWFPSHG